MVGVVEHERGGLINRRHPRAGGGIGLRAGMNGKGRKSRLTVGHVCVLFLVSVQKCAACLSQPRSPSSWVDHISTIRKGVLR